MTLRDSTMQALGQALKDPAALEEVAENLNAIEGIAASEAAFIDGVVAGTATANKAVVLGASKEIATLGLLSVAGLNYTTGTVTATANGLTTAIIPDSGMIQAIAVTSANAAHIVVLPTPVFGKIVILYVGANGYELRSSDPATIAINGGTGASVQSAIAANQMVLAICTSATTWHALEITAATLTAVEAAA